MGQPPLVLIVWSIENGVFVFSDETLIRLLAMVEWIYETERSSRVCGAGFWVDGRMRVLAHGDTGNPAESG